MKSSRKYWLIFERFDEISGLTVTGVGCFIDRCVLS